MHYVRGLCSTRTTVHTGIVHIRVERADVVHIRVERAVTLSLRGEVFFVAVWGRLLGRLRMSMYRREMILRFTLSLDTRVRRPARAPRARCVARTRARSRNTHTRAKEKTKLSSRARLFIIYKTVCNSSFLIQSLNACIRDSGDIYARAPFSHDKRHDTQVVLDRSMRATG